MKNDDLYLVVRNVRKVLNSGIPLSEISVETNVSMSVLKKLSAEHQDIGDTKFSTIFNINDYYHKHKESIDLIASKNDGLADVKLPRKVNKFIKELSKATQKINDGSQNLYVDVSKVWVKEKKEIHFLHYALVVRQDLYLESEPYNLTFTNPIDNDIDCISNIKLHFDEMGLISKLKEIKQKDGYIKLDGKYGEHFISVSCRDKSIEKYGNYDYYGKIESDFFRLEIE
ncbi:TPA: hypothetical protein M5605_002525 [Staphylococcus aureus]|nr:hypothetical protein [Staphylococcus aureus]